MKTKVFLNQSSSGRGGPSTFARNFRQSLSVKDIQVTDALTSECRAALFVINAKDAAKAKALGVFSAGRYAGLCHPEWCDKMGKQYDKNANQHFLREMLVLDQIIFQSGYSRDVFAEVLGRKYKNYSIIHNGGDPKLFYPTKSVPSGPLVIGCVGVMRYEYRLRTFCELILRLKQSGHNVRGLVIGPLDDENKKVVSKYRNKVTLDIDDRYLTPKEVRERHWRMSFLYHPIMGDACPNTVVEAMLSGTPIVCSSYGGEAALVGSSNRIIDVDGSTVKRWIYDNNYIEASLEIAQHTIANLVTIRKQTLIRAKELTLDKMATKYQKALRL